ANSIDLIALGGVGAENSSLEFEQFGARFNDLTEIQISTDGTNFVTVGDNLDFDVHSQSASNVWPNPNIKRVNLAPYLNATTAQTVWIRFSWTTNYPNSATNPNVWIAYGWYIDDIKIATNATNDLTISEEYYGTAAFPYSRVPVSQIQPIEFTAKATNSGIADQPGTVLNVDINGTIEASSTPQTVLAGTTDSLVATTWTPPATLGVSYATTLYLSSDSIDDIPVDDTAATFAPFEITEYVYAYDDYGTPGTGGGLDDADANFEAGNLFDIWTPINLTAIDVVVGSGTAVGSNFKGVLYESTAAGFTKVAETQFYQTTAASIGNVTQLLFSAPIPLNANATYFAGISTLTEFYYGTSGKSPDGSGAAAQTSRIYYGTMDAPISGKNYYTSNTPMIRMNFDPSLIGVEEVSNNVKFNVFPNPSNGIFNINLSSNENNTANLTVKNVVGQTVLTETVNVSGNTKHQISLADYSKGIYFLTVGNETVKLIVE
ncbi:MAG: T9SS type A sorting domain-containing protein, partial [Vicingaceae bacterium]